MRLNKNFCFALAVIAGVTLDDAARSQELSHAATKTNDRHSGLSRQAERRSSSSNQFRGKKESNTLRSVDHAPDKEPKGSGWGGFYGGLNAGSGRSAAPQD
jgi:hypothetical protein